MEDVSKILDKCAQAHAYFEEHFYDSYSAEKAHYHLHLAQEAISEYILDKKEGFVKD